MKTLGAIAIVICLVTAGCGYHDRYRHRAEIRQSQEDFRRAGWEAREEMQRARQQFHRDLRDAREDFRRSMREAGEDLPEPFHHRY
jgi:outer membrane lipopolysaccharide assembly protein LptE/RlpB